MERRRDKGAMSPYSTARAELSAADRAPQRVPAAIKFVGETMRKSIAQTTRKSVARNKPDVAQPNRTTHRLEKNDPRNRHHDVRPVAVAAVRWTPPFRKEPVMTNVVVSKPKLVGKVKQLLQKLPANDWCTVRDWINSNLQTRRVKDQIERIKRVGVAGKVVFDTARNWAVADRKIATVVSYGPKRVHVQLDDPQGLRHKRWRVPYHYVRPLADVVLERAGGKGGANR